MAFRKSQLFIWFFLVKLNGMNELIATRTCVFIKYCFIKNKNKFLASEKTNNKRRIIKIGLYFAKEISANILEQKQTSNFLKLILKQSKNVLAPNRSMEFSKRVQNTILVPTSKLKKIKKNSDVERVLGVLKQLQNQWENALDADEEAWARNEIDNSIKNLEYDLVDLEETITRVKKDTNRFSGITDNELEARNLFVANTRSFITSLKKQISEAPQSGNSTRHKRNVTFFIFPHSEFFLIFC